MNAPPPNPDNNSSPNSSPITAKVPVTAETAPPDIPNTLVP